MREFWFAPTSPRPLALMRIGLAVVLLGDVLWHAPFVVESYSTAGRPLPLPPLAGGGWLPVPSAGVAVLAHGLLVGALIAVGLGLLTRASLLVAFVLLGWFGLLDFPDTLNKYTAISLHLVLLLAVSGSHRVWSLDRRFFEAHDRVRLVDAWPRRLMQLLVCHVYLGAAITKMRMQDFANGDVLAFSLIDDRWAGGWLGTGPGAWLATQPRLLVLASFATLAFEFSFPLLVWFGRTRRPMLLAAVAFHVALGCTLSLRTFTPTMLVALLAFVEERDLAVFRGMGFQSRPSASRAQGSTVSESHPTWRLPFIGVGLWTAVLLLVGGTSYLAHRTADPYGVFSREAAEPPAAVPEDVAATMLENEFPAAATLVHRIDVGSRVSHFQVFGRGDRFRSGDVVHVLIRFQQAHAPVSVTATLVDPDGNASQPVERFVTREQSHLLYQFLMTPQFPRGEYTLRIEIAGELVDERTFALE